MAKQNKFKLAINFIEAEAIEADKSASMESENGNFDKAFGWQKYIEGLNKALSYLCVIEGKKNDTLQK